MTVVGGVSYGYDNNGNQTTRGSDTFAYDHENRLSQTVIGGASSSSTYNGDGLRMSHTASSVTKAYTWDIGSKLPLILQERIGLQPPLDLVQTTYVYGLDLISSTDTIGSQTYFLYDGLGSTTGLTDGNGNNPVSYSYDVFGGIRTQTGTSSNYWLFTGEQRDSDSSLYYLRARYYDPAIGRFVSTDPIRAGQPYAYVSNNPGNFVDPYGLIDLTPGFVDDAWDCASDPVKCGKETFDDTWTAVTSGPMLLDIINVLDAFPLAETCVLVGAVGGGIVGGVIGTGVAPGPGTVVGAVSVGGGAAGSGLVICGIAEDIIGVVATTANMISLAQSDCEWGDKLKAMGINLVNGFADLPPFLGEPVEWWAYQQQYKLCGKE